jgi:hypothetical protein
LGTIAQAWRNLQCPLLSNAAKSILNVQKADSLMLDISKSNSHVGKCAYHIPKIP